MILLDNEDHLIKKKLFSSSPKHTIPGSILAGFYYLSPITLTGITCLTKLTTMWMMWPRQNRVAPLFRKKEPECRPVEKQ
jgi:hypothetical protein